MEVDSDSLKNILTLRYDPSFEPLLIKQKWEDFKEKAANGEERKKVLDELKVERYCCRAMFLGQVDLIDTATQFKKF